VRGFAFEQIARRQAEGHELAPLAVKWVAGQLGLPTTTVHRALIALHRRGEVVWSGRVLPETRVRLWGLGDGRPHRWPPPKPGPVALPGARPAHGGDLLELALDRARPGNRNAVGLWLACQLRDTGRPIEMAWETMQLYVSLVRPGDHPYTPREAEASLAQAYRREPRSPFLVVDD
jgi:hypothetical protein